MPAAFGRRRRQNSEDIEEDSGAGTQPQAAEDVSDPETSQRRRPKLEKSYANGKAKKKPAATQDSDEDDDDQDDGSEEEAIDVTTLRDQPLQREAADKLKGVVEDWKTLESNTRQQWGMIAGIAGAIADATDEEQAKKVRVRWPLVHRGGLTETCVQPIQQLDDIMRELMDLSREMTGHSEALHEIRQRITQGEQIVCSISSLLPLPWSISFDRTMHSSNTLTLLKKRRGLIRIKRQGRSMQRTRDILTLGLLSGFVFCHSVWPTDSDGGL